MQRFSDAGAAAAALCETMARLRAPGGCPWDREQTLASLKTYLLEETYETLDAMDGNADAHCEELGDLLLQIVFQSEVTHESGSFDFAAVARGIHNKLLRRHPHVFGDAKADDAQSALGNWERIKQSERRADASCLDGMPKALPALLLAQRTGEKAAALGFDWARAEDVLPKVDEELREVREAYASGDTHALRDELGDLLFAIANFCRHVGIDAEDALRQATGKFSTRFRRIEPVLKDKKAAKAEVGLDELEAMWESAKSFDTP